MNLLRKAALVISLVGVFGLPARADSVVKETDLMADPSRDLTRLNYYPHEGKLYLAPEVEFAPTDLGIPSRGVTPQNTSSAHYWEAELNVVYGLPLEGLRFNVTESSLIHRWTDTTSAKTGFVTQSDSAGFSDPTFELQYRYFETEPLGFSGDIAFSVSPSWVTDYAAESTSGGSNGKGYGTASLLATEYKLFSAVDLGLQENLTEDFSGNQINQVTPANSYTRASGLTFSTTATGRIHLGPDFYAQGALEFEFANSFDQTNSAATPVTSNVQTPFHVIPSLLAGYRVLDRFCVDAIYTYQNYTRTTVATPPNTDTFVLENTIELRARVEI